MFIEFIEKVQKFLYEKVIICSKGPIKVRELRSITPDSIYPYDLVVSLEDYAKLIEQGFKEDQYEKPIIGMVLGIEAYEETPKGVVPRIVKVFYFNMRDFRYPIIKLSKVEDLKLMSSPIKDLVQYSSIMNTVNTMMDEISAEDLDNLLDDIDDDDEGEIIQ